MNETVTLLHKSLKRDKVVIDQTTVEVVKCGTHLGAGQEGIINLSYQDAGYMSASRSSFAVAITGASIYVPLSLRERWPDSNHLLQCESSRNTPRKGNNQAMAHCNTIPSQILKLVPRHEFEALAKSTTAVETSEPPLVGHIS